MPKSRAVQQAGAIVVRRRASGARVLLVTGRRNPFNWIFPKGHVERGETLEEAAAREALEEAGVRGRVVAEVGAIKYHWGETRYRVHYFVMVTRQAGAAEPGRQLQWCSYRQALRRLAYETLRAVLRDAQPLIAGRRRARKTRRPRRAA